MGRDDVTTNTLDLEEDEGRKEERRRGGGEKGWSVENVEREGRNLPG